MFGTGGGKKQRPAGGTGYLVRPRLGALKSVYSSRPFAAHSPDKRKKIRKSSAPKMEWRRHKPDSADTAHREAVGRLRILLAESYAPPKRPLRELDSAGEETDNQSLVSAGSRNSRLSRNYYHNLVTPRKYYYYPNLRSGYGGLGTDTDKSLLHDAPKVESPAAPPELMSFIERQDEYIEELEKESKFCKEELSTLLSKVKEVINENEHLHDKQRSRMIKSLFQHIETETETETETDNKNGRRIADERSAVERRYTQQIEQLSAELGAQWETTNKLHLELDIQRRENGDLRRESAQKQALIDELKKDMQNRIKAKGSRSKKSFDYKLKFSPCDNDWIVLMPI
ncbi:unnamed protein product [Phaedon cochleariae]|uniref:Uncharacterized protein n=1 Tax=Phaedon cochleariae TaxID=80249 RepID=A0A9N9SE98_PHACE|nr:unnamed protein product [Phaedon cochleariae]